MKSARLTAPEDLMLPREVVLASAGTGKTFTLSSRLIGLLALGAPADTLLASTFTRAAAGEILTRVLSRLARASLDEEEARILAREALLPLGPPRGPEPAWNRELFSDLLRSLVRDLHRANVGTLDSFFVRIAGSFSGELGMPPDWAISDEPTAKRMESEALQEVLSEAKPREMVELVRMTMRGESGRGVHGRLLAQLNELRALIHQRGFSHQNEIWKPPQEVLFSRGDDETGPESWEGIINELERAPLPQTARGKPDARFQQALYRSIEALREKDWLCFCQQGLGAKILAGERDFFNKPIPAELQGGFQRALEKVTEALKSDLANQSRALRTLVLGFDAALERIHRREGSYRFEDITFLLAHQDPLKSRTDLWYRLDQKAHHLLLDEFQDTSRAQWEALEPLASELLAGHREERSALVVADPKQSIYGWRGAEPSLVRSVGKRFAMNSRSLHHSYRSSRSVLGLANQVFSHLPENPIWDLRPELRAAAEVWGREFPEHLPALDLPGYVALEVGPAETRGRGSERPALTAWSARRIRELHARAPHATLGVLVRRNAAATALMAQLRSLGVDASEEGSSALTDSPAVSTVLALFRLTDHPGDSVARYQVARSPLGAVIGLGPEDDPSRARRLALALRRDLLTQGYGALIGGWTEDLLARGLVFGRELARLRQLEELAYRWEGRSTLRPQDFVRFVQHEAMESPTGGRVRVMTVHRAKGLEFDIVVLPEIDLPLSRGQGLYHAVLPLRDPASGQVTRVFPSLNKPLRPLFPEIEEAGRQDIERELQDALGVAYVAITRARHALHLITGADPEGTDPKLSFSFSGLLRGGLNLESIPGEEGGVLFQDGDPDWAEKLTWAGEEGEGEGDLPQEPGIPEAPLDKTAARTRFFPQRTPSDLKSPGPDSLKRILSLSGAAGRRKGTIIHTWLETLYWLEDWRPEAPKLHALGKDRFPDLTLEESNHLQETLMNWLGHAQVRRRLLKTTYPSESLVRNEEPFAVRIENTLFRGRIDRLVLKREQGRLTGAEVLDFKTDPIPRDDKGLLEKAIEDYRGQTDIYRQAVSVLYGIPLESVCGALVFLSPGRVVDL